MTRDEMISLLLEHFPENRELIVIKPFVEGYGTLMDYHITFYLGQNNLKNRFYIYKQGTTYPAIELTITYADEPKTATT